MEPEPPHVDSHAYLSWNTCTGGGGGGKPMLGRWTAGGVHQASLARVSLGDEEETLLSISTCCITTIRIEAQTLTLYNCLIFLEPSACWRQILVECDGEMFTDRHCNFDSNLLTSVAGILEFHLTNYCVCKCLNLKQLNKRNIIYVPVDSEVIGD